MKFPLFRAVALLALVWLMGSRARAEEVTLSVGMSYDKAIEALQKCGARDVTGDKHAPASPLLLYWELLGYNTSENGFGILVATSEYYGKLSHLNYWVGAPNQRVELAQPENERSALSLTFDTEKKVFAVQELPPALPSPDPARHWMVRVEVLIAALPQEKALALLPDLRDDSKVDAAYAQIIAAIQHKEAKLVGYPVAYSYDGEQAVAETIFEKIYPTQFQLPKEPQNAGGAAQSYADPYPSAFEKRNAGITLEIRGTVREGGKSVQLQVQPQHVEFDGLDAYKFLKAPGVSGRIDQPRFYTNKESLSLVVRNGQRLLLGVHPSLQTDLVEIHLLQAVITAAP